MIINHTTLSALFTGFKVLFNKAFEGTRSDWEKLAMIVPSTTSQEVYAWLGMTTGFRKWVGDRVVQNLKSHNFTIVNEPFENTVGVARDNIEDDQIGVYSPLFAQLGEDARTHPDTLIFALLAAGFATRCYDGQYFFDTDHPVVGAGGAVTSVSNMQAGSGTPWFLLDTSRVIKPLIFQKRKDYTFVSLDKETDANVFNRREYLYGVDARCNVGYGLWQMAFGSKAALDATNYGAARAAMMGMKGDNGRPLGIRPTTLVVPPTLEKAALEVVKAERNADGATNVYRDSAEVLVTPWLA
ncbi:MAG: Mu-like prophage major head subunit gpT family protein [Pseudodesulfovibrio sp.]|uniref:Mu-like prophage major head subunit gpT n=1 Tax=Pseudodesulfovibrio aespoeensis (strain ATCC 700646 / DSM 10631 / Aspo-2) TaxID=643562 RepID=E6VUA0_PSEA9|nr:MULTISPECIES: Mu-like prophage major head subunit gpT family protein [Pseudodesulfovibrio]MBU4191340.1 Mu-like prophage major head subunit gpT family protein [Pseudomonadota bacterium]ADU63407.1 Mu-like prophage major head subunit gpT [Pseudodesulfovibrio aespoeensis Aspo-2]MBU4243454.1 Mu-like prophage major head subunit gpT family protein [Pseudomonadota bacterium]MBU4378632.1 Mu-like prophage major head subunit gpT family protein [Pseudomonadota bacterium]MBU4473788.1 Mu-like prophage ma